MTTIKIKQHAFIRVTRDFTSLSVTNDKLTKRYTVNQGLYAFENIVPALNCVSLQRIGRFTGFYAHANKMEWNSNGIFEIESDLLEKCELSNKMKLFKALNDIDSAFLTRFQNGDKSSNLRARAVLVQKYLATKDCVSCFSHNKKIPVFFDGKNVKTWKKWEDVTFGMQRAKIIPANEIESYGVNIDELKKEYFAKYGDYSVSVVNPTLKNTKLLSEWHIVNNISSCMLRDNVTLSRLKSFYRFYRRSGFKYALIKDSNGNILGRVIVDSNGNFTRVYSLSNYVESKGKEALKSAGLTESSDYESEFIALVKNDDILSIPYIDGRSQQFDILDLDYKTLYNAKSLAKCIFHYNGDFEATNTDFKVSVVEGVLCDCCGEHYDNDREGTTTASGESICDSCYQNDYFYCEECEEVHHNDSQTRFIYQLRNGNFEESWCCGSCADSMEQIPFRT